jgi:hypothetical protein
MIDKKIFANQAKTWIGTKFLHQGRLKKNTNSQGGCDCLGLLIGVIKELSLEKKIFHNLYNIDTQNYGKIIKTSVLLDNMKKYFKEKNINSIERGDIALFAFKNLINPHHIGIINEINNELTLIHSFIQSGYIVEHILDYHWISNIHSIYEI